MNQAIAETIAATPAATSQNPVMILIGLVILFAFFLIPGFVAHSRKHINTVPVALTGLLFGWTLIGWGVALIWSFTSQAPVAIASVSASAMGAAPSAAGKPAAAKPSLEAKVAKYIGLTVGALVILLAILNFFAKKPMDQAREPAVPPAKMGVPVPAEDLFGE